VVAELTEAGMPPSFAELAYELDAENEAVRGAITTIETLGLVEPYSDADGITRWRALLQVRPRAEFEIVGTFDTPALTAKIRGHSSNPDSRSFLVGVERDDPAR
jgi:hypothetical protein